jgi:CDP-diacylglycerol---glycerol-3-phosphate 3-phosphatidyltransferase
MPLIVRGAKMHLWRSPNVASWKERILGKRLSELLGVQHAKVHVFDDCVILSGANLSRSYFEDRKDRYVCIQDRSVADFYYGFLEAVGSVSHSATGSASMLNSDREDQTGKVLAKYFGQSHVGSKSDIEDHDAVFLAPTVQLGSYGLRNDEQTTVSILESIQSGKVVLTSGYFNLTPSYERQLFSLGSRPNVDLAVIVSSPEANAWFNSKGKHSRHVPSGYSWLEAAFIRRIPQICRLKMLEWKLGDAWSYHCKGLWHFGKDNSSLTIIGSANFGNRSVNLDLESQAVIFSENPEFKRALESELEAVESNCEPVTLETVEQEWRTPPLIWRVLLPVLKRWM